MKNKNIIILDWRKKPKSYKEGIKLMPEGYRLLKIQEAIDLMNSGFKVDKTRWKQFFFEQPFEINKRLNKVADLNSGNFDNGLGVNANGDENFDSGYSFGVFIKK